MRKPADRRALDRSPLVGTLCLLNRHSHRLVDLDQLAGCQVAPRSRGNPLKVQRPQPDAAQAGYRNPDGIHQAPHDMVEPFMQHDGEGGSFRRLPEQPHLFWHDMVIVNSHTITKPLELVLGGALVGENQILLVDPVTGVHDPVGEIAVIGEQHQALGGAVQPTDRIDALADIDQVHHGPAIPLVTHGGDEAGRLVEQDVARWLRSQDLSVHANLIARREYPGAKLRDDRSVHPDLPGSDHLLGAAA